MSHLSVPSWKEIGSESCLHPGKAIDDLVWTALAEGERGHDIIMLIVNNAEKGIRTYCEPIEKILLKEQTSFRTIDYSELPQINLTHYPGIILSGSPRGDDIVDHHLPFFRWILDWTNPIFGICAGHHIVGKLFGAELIRNAEKEQGEIQIKIVQRDAIFEGLLEVFVGHGNHNDSISLSVAFDLLATSDSCRNQMVKHKLRHLYTTQFHPEVTTPRLIVNFIKLCKKFSSQVASF